VYLRSIHCVKLYGSLVGVFKIKEN
jgi:hypothetical protein